jgi:hypothetical protein
MCARDGFERTILPAILGADGSFATPVRDERSAGTGLSSCDQVHECTWSHAMVSRYQKRISGPLLDRIDIHIEVPLVDY